MIIQRTTNYLFVEILMYKEQGRILTNSLTAKEI